MKKTKTLLSLLVTLLFIIIILYSCKKDDEIEAIDKELYNMASATDGFTWFKFSSALLDKSSGSGHPQPYLRVMYNTVAATQLDSVGKIITGAAFAEGSLVVKELYENSTTLGRYAVLYKKVNDPNADVNGWVWGYINADGSVAESGTKKGSSCINCHSQADNIDYMLMNKYFP
ncbi:MAG: cytochrome P460 family protein [Bacteroidales bacterium]|nr:cytochrome P460 family protein [Bacteroidales bacterium]